MDGTSENIRDYLKKPYARILTPDEEYGGYTAEILEFPGCVTEGDTADEALGNLEVAAEGWIEATLNANQRIPEPSDTQEYRGRIALRLPRSLHRRAVQLAEREGTSLNQFLVAAVAERVGAGTLYAEMAQRLERRAMRVAVNYLQKGTAVNEAVTKWPLSSCRDFKVSAMPFKQGIMQLMVRPPSTEMRSTETSAQMLDLAARTEHGGRTD
ncbi:MAG: type II toxin-antitoxin system HicB family antitoxin [Actinomycetota bacterium]|nr:type II toxin-antitoxin system HicB family antitoxin [Actinomycetota bacterium]